jgi:hypothetical protein
MALYVLVEATAEDVATFGDPRRALPRSNFEPYPETALLEAAKCSKIHVYRGVVLRTSLLAISNTYECITGL